MLGPPEQYQKENPLEGASSSWCRKS